MVASLAGVSESARAGGIRATKPDPAASVNVKMDRRKEFEYQLDAIEDGTTEVVFTFLLLCRTFARKDSELALLHAENDWLRKKAALLEIGKTCSRLTKSDDGVLFSLKVLLSSECLAMHK
jgi:hypothetical protein